MEKHWFLESIAADGSHVMEPVRKLPFRIGRDPAVNDFVVDARGLSRQHAVLEADASGKLRLTDLGSTNGTFLNRERLTAPRLVGENDVVHFGNAEFRLGRGDAVDSVVPDDGGRTMLLKTGGKTDALDPGTHQLSANFVRHEREFREVLAGHGIAVAVQPIVDLGSNQVYAYEMLGRCRHPLLQSPPSHLFELARQLDLEAELSAAFCRHGIPLIAPRLGSARLFINAHPKETFTEAFFQSLKAFRALPTAPRIVVELHETAVVEIDQMRRLAERLMGIGLEFAYDDYGAGQSRINEVTLVTPHYVKFDMSLVKGIAQADPKRRDYIGKEVATLRGMGAMCLAEGVEAAEDAVACRELGFQLIQGYITGKPALVDAA